MTAPIDKAAEALITSRPGRKLGLAGRPGVAREVFASIDTDELARVLWPYPHSFESALPEHKAFYRAKAEAVKAHLLKEDA